MMAAPPVPVTDHPRQLSPAEAIAAALSTFVPGPASLISPSGRGVRVIMLTLEKCGFEIVSREKGRG